VETSKADFNNKLFEDLGDERQLERERESMCAKGMSPPFEALRA